MTAPERTLLQDHQPTIRMPAPGGQATVVLKRPAAAGAGAPRAGVELQRLMAGINPLLTAAGTLLALVAQLRSTTSHHDPAGLRVRLLEWVAEFEGLAGANGVPRPKVTAARYVLCAFIDEVIAQTPWGAGGVWAERNLLQEFHEERWGGEKAFQLLERLGQDPTTNADLLELFYVCLQLGFEGRYRGVANGRAQLDAIAERVRDVIRPAMDSAAARTLSINWQGVDARERRRASALPLWAGFAAAGALLLGLFLLLNDRLETLASPVFHRIHSVPAALRVGRADAAPRARLAPLLQAEVASGALQVRDEAQRSVLTLSADSLFVPGSAQIEPGRVALLQRVAQALKDLPGQVDVIGHTDNAAVGSLQFPSHWHLSRAQAQAVLAVLDQSGARGARMRAEGRADVEPVAGNDTPAGRTRNRRIEIELRLPRPEG